jgi:hypothetical protein
VVARHHEHVPEGLGEHLDRLGVGVDVVTNVAGHDEGVLGVLV